MSHSRARKPAPPGRTVDVKVPVDAALRRAWKAALDALLDAHRAGAGAFDRKYEALAIAPGSCDGTCGPHAAQGGRRAVVPVDGLVALKHYSTNPA
jgi:hypothetical protein